MELAAKKREFPFLGFGFICVSAGAYWASFTSGSESSTLRATQEGQLYEVLRRMLHLAEFPADQIESD
jgi:hypothetical protein